MSFQIKKNEKLDFQTPLMGGTMNVWLISGRRKKVYLKPIPEVIGNSSNWRLNLVVGLLSFVYLKTSKPKKILL